MLKKTRVKIVTVNYFGCDDTVKFLESINVPSSIDVSVVVVDNSNSSFEWKALNAKLKEREGSVGVLVELVQSLSNSGYVGGGNLGRSKLGVVEGDILILCNNDIEFDERFFHLLKKKCVLFDQGALLLAPNVIDAKTSRPLNPFLSDRPTCRHIRTLRFIYCHFLIAMIFHYTNSLKSMIRGKKVSHEVEQRDIYASHGSIFVMHCSMWEQPIDDSYFMYAEEVTLAELVITKGGRVVYCPELNVVHNSHSSTGSGLSKRVFEWKKNAISYISKKYVWG